MKATVNTTTIAAAIRTEKHEQVRRILGLSSWKIRSWAEYASWKKHGRRWVSIEWGNKCRQNAAANGFVELPEVAA